ncbi:MAG: hypothetical protein KIS62_07535 [Ramlibacter sp.]|nr:hypothetical protein [Ramlibacter sp.]
MSHVTPADLQADESEFHSPYRVFVQAVEMLAMSAEVQCAAMGDYNVAWELKDDIQAGKYLVNRGYLNPEQECWILALVGALEAVPAQILLAGAGRETNLIAMQHPSWVPLRAIAALTLQALVPFTMENARYLNLARDAT